jgi:peptidylprolyl isomerase
MLALSLAAGLAAAAALPGTAAEEGNTVTTPLGLKMIDTKVGTGAQPKKGQTVVVDYTGWLYENGAKGAKFDSSVDRGYPFMFKIGKGEVIQGWDDGVASMKVGGKRTLIIPPALGYGTRGTGGTIPPNATLLFEVELLDIKG